MAKHKGKVVAVAELTRKLRVPRPFLRKILQSLNRSGILKSLRGQGGGFILAKDATQIFLMDIMRIFQGKLRLNDCLLKKLICPNKRSCPLRKKIAKIESYVLKELSAINIASLLE